MLEVDSQPETASIPPAGVTIAEVLTRLAEIQQHLQLIDHKIDVYRGRLAAGDADRLWAPTHQPDAP
ncbi:hypothetical protein [Actinoallomurus sp. CA-142502]|uniref:hypothetical protein n=1 Tax=Actinoallomurus sp. CA-142502 TaxID=3239885 RepID=UPI003D9039B6